jgi:hypothetical protein
MGTVVPILFLTPENKKGLVSKHFGANPFLYLVRCLMNAAAQSKTGAVVLVFEKIKP